MSVLVCVLIVVWVLQCYTSNVPINVGCDDVISGSIDNATDRDIYILQDYIDVISYTVNTCQPNGEIELNLETNVGSFTEPCPNNETGQIVQITENSLLTSRVTQPTFDVFDLDETGNYTINIECETFDTEPDVISCGDIVNGSTSNGTARFIFSTCDILDSFTLSTCFDTTNFDTRIRVDSLSQNAFVETNDDDFTFCTNFRSRLTIDMNNVDTFNDDFLIKVFGFGSESGVFTLDLVCNFKNESDTECPTLAPSVTPSSTPTLNPTNTPSDTPSLPPTISPSLFPTNTLSATPTNIPSETPTLNPSSTPTSNPTNPPTSNPTGPPTSSLTDPPTSNPTNAPTGRPTFRPTDRPTIRPTNRPIFGSDDDSDDDDDDDDDDSHDDAMATILKKDNAKSSFNIFNIESTNNNYSIFIYLVIAFILGMVTCRLCRAIYAKICTNKNKNIKYGIINSTDVTSCASTNEINISDPN